MEKVGEELESLFRREDFGSACPYFLLLEISKCSVPNGSFFTHGIPIRQVAAFQQMVV